MMIHLLCYRAWPDFRRVNQKWKSVVEPLFQTLKGKEIVYTKVNGGKWLLVENAIFNQVPEKHPELLESVLLAANVPVVSVQSHVIDSIGSFTDAKDIKNITASVMRKEMRNAPLVIKTL